MGSPSTCEQCGKKFKVFTKRKKCLHCMTVVCKYCYAPHLTTKHPSAALRMTPSSSHTNQHHARDLQSRAAGGRAVIGTAYNIHNERANVFDDEDDVHFLSPVHANDARTAMEYEEDMLLNGVEHVNVVSGGDDEDDDDDDDDEEEDDDDDEEEDDDDDAEDEEDDEAEPYLVSEDSNYNDNNREKQRRAAGRFHKRRMSMEEQHYQYAEFLQIQNAVATWARKERDATRKQRVAERDSCYSMTPIPNVRSTREYQERELFVVSYTVAITLLVWGVYALGCFAYIRARGEVVTFVLLE